MIRIASASVWRDGAPFKWLKYELCILSHLNYLKTMIEKPLHAVHYAEILQDLIWSQRVRQWLSDFHFHPAMIFLCLHAVFAQSLNQVQLFATPWTVAHQRDSLPTPKLRLFQFSSVAQLCLTLCDPMDCSTPGLPVHHQLPEFTQSHVHWVGDAIQPSHPLSSPFPPTFNLSQHQGLFQWVSSLHQVDKVVDFQLQH